MKEILLYHRRHSVRILHEFLLGEAIIQRTRNQEERMKTADEKKADRLYLYRHLTECSAALQLLLNCSPQYWSFIPMDQDEADQLDRQISPIDFDPLPEWSCRERSDEEVDWCLANVPSPIDGTRFSRLQQHQQRLFFKHGYDLLILPHRHLDLFNLSIVFLCSFNDRSMNFSCIVSLF